MKKKNMTSSPQNSPSNFGEITWENCYDEEIIDHGDISSRLLTPPPWNLPETLWRYLGRDRFQPIFARYRTDSANIVIKLVEERLFLKTTEFILKNYEKYPESVSFTLSPNKLNEDELINILSEGHTLLVYDLTHQQILGVLMARIHSSGLRNTSFIPKIIQKKSNCTAKIYSGSVFPKEGKRDDSEKMKASKMQNNILSWLQQKKSSYSQKPTPLPKAFRNKQVLPESLTKFIPYVRHVIPKNKQSFLQKQERLKRNSKILRFSNIVDTTFLEELQVGHKTMPKELLNLSSNRRPQSILKISSYENHLNNDTRAVNQMDGISHLCNTNYSCTKQSSEGKNKNNSIGKNDSNKYWLYDKLLETSNVNGAQVKETYFLSHDGRRKVGNLIHNEIRKNQLPLKSSERKNIREKRMQDNSNDNIKFERNALKEKINKPFNINETNKTPITRRNYLSNYENNVGAKNIIHNMNNQDYLTHYYKTGNKRFGDYESGTKLGNRENIPIKEIIDKQINNDNTNKNNWKYMTNLVFEEYDDVEISYLEPKMVYPNLEAKEVPSIFHHKPYKKGAKTKTLTKNGDCLIHKNSKLFQDLCITKYLYIHLLIIDSEWNQPDIFTNGLINGLVLWAKYINPAENLDAIIAIPKDDLYSELYKTAGFKMIKKINKLEYIDDEDKNTSYEENVLQQGNLSDERYYYINIIGATALSYWNYIGKY